MKGSPSVGQAFGQGVEDYRPPMLWDFVFILPLALILDLLFNQRIQCSLQNVEWISNELKALSFLPCHNECDSKASRESQWVGNTIL